MAAAMQTARMIHRRRCEVGVGSAWGAVGLSSAGASVLGGSTDGDAGSAGGGGSAGGTIRVSSGIGAGSGSSKSLFGGGAGLGVARRAGVPCFGSGPMIRQPHCGQGPSTPASSGGRLRLSPHAGHGKRSGSMGRGSGAECHPADGLSNPEPGQPRGAMRATRYSGSSSATSMSISASARSSIRRQSGERWRSRSFLPAFR